MSLKDKRCFALATLMFLLTGLDCHAKQSRYAPPDGPPEAPEGEGWYCFHATSPHDISGCKRDLESCRKMQKAYSDDKTKLPERQTNELHRSHLDRHSKAFAAFPDELDEPPENDAPPEPDNADSTGGNICSIDPSSCPSVDVQQWSIPTYSTCAPRNQAYCSAYYHEFNFYKKDEENHWRYLCAETAESCNVWRDLWHLHLVKRPCTPIP